jgi:hypothetical protein
MMDGADRIAFSDVELLDANGHLLLCRTRGRTFGVPPLRILPGTTIARAGDRGTLVLERDMARRLGLVE